MIRKFVCVSSRLLAAAGIALSAAACAGSALAPTSSDSSTPATGAAAAMIAAGPWQLQALTRSDSSTVVVAEPDHFTLEIVPGDRLAIRADCNRASGAYGLTGATLSVGPLASTKAYCSSAPLDDEYLGLLSGDNTATVTATTLVLSSSRGALRFGR